MNRREFSQKLFQLIEEAKLDIDLTDIRIELEGMADGIRNEENVKMYEHVLARKIM